MNYTIFPFLLVIGVMLFWEIVYFIQDYSYIKSERMLVVLSSIGTVLTFWLFVILFQECFGMGVGV